MNWLMTIHERCTISFSLAKVSAGLDENSVTRDMACVLIASNSAIKYYHGMLWEGEQYITFRFDWNFMQNRFIFWKQR